MEVIDYQICHSDGAFWLEVAVPQNEDIDDIRWYESHTFGDEGPSLSLTLQKAKFYFRWASTAQHAKRLLKQLEKS